MRRQITSSIGQRLWLVAGWQRPSLACFPKGKGREAQSTSSLGSAVFHRDQKQLELGRQIFVAHTVSPPGSAFQEVKGEQTLGQSFSPFTGAWGYTRAQGIRY